MESQCCIACDRGSFEHFEKKDAKDGQPIEISVCLSCGLVQLSVIPTEEKLTAFYKEGYRAEYRKSETPKPRHVYRAGRLAKKRIDTIKQFLPQGSRLLDIGAGGGEFVYLASASGYISSGIDPSSGYLEFGRSNYSIDLKQTTLSEYEVKGKFSCVTMFHVLEHLSRPRLELERVHSILDEDGILVIEVPSLEARDSSPTNFYFKAHISYFTVKSLLQMTLDLFDVQFTRSDKVIFVVLRKKKQRSPVHNIDPNETVRLSLERVRKKTLVEYLMNMKVSSPVNRAFAAWNEYYFSRKRSPRQILNRFMQ